MVELAQSWLLIGQNQEEEPGMWFIFHHDAGGTLAIDITAPHPRIDFRLFEKALHFKRPKALKDLQGTDDIVLLGGPERPDDGLIILYEPLTEARNKDAYVINEHFAFLSYTLKIIPGTQQPSLHGHDNAPTKLALKPETGFIVAVGFRMWEGSHLTEQVKAGRWRTLPANPQVLFYTAHQQRRETALKSLN